MLFSKKIVVIFHVLVVQTKIIYSLNVISVSSDLNIWKEPWEMPNFHMKYVTMYVGCKKKFHGQTMK